MKESRSTRAPMMKALNLAGPRQVYRVLELDCERRVAHAAPAGPPRPDYLTRPLHRLTLAVARREARRPVRPVWAAARASRRGRAVPVTALFSVPDRTKAAPSCVQERFRVF
jgi:hypothetical protein